jgi:hypothetical protein
MKCVLALLVLAVTGVPTHADEIREWSDATASAFVKERYREAASARRIVAIRCSHPPMDEFLAGACSALRFELADAMTRRRFDVVEPRDGFDAVATWDHVGCGRDGAPDYLGWNVIEIRMPSRAPKRRDDEIVVLF